MGFCEDCNNKHQLNENDQFREKMGYLDTIHICRFQLEISNDSIGTSAREKSSINFAIIIEVEIVWSLINLFKPFA